MSDRLVLGDVNYLADIDERPTFHAQDHRRDNLKRDPRTVRIRDARVGEAPSLVLFPGDDTRRGTGIQGLRFRPGSGNLRGSFGVR